jgi:spore maturation protein SpmA
MILVPSAIVTYRMSVTPEKVTNTDFIIIMVCGIIAGIISMREQYNKRKVINEQFDNIFKGKS